MLQRTLCHRSGREILSLIVQWLEGVAANQGDPGSIPGGGPKRFHDSSSFVSNIVGECISRRGRHSLARILSPTYHSFQPRTAPELPVTTGVGLGFWVVPSSHMLKTEFLCHFCGKGFSGAAIRDIGYQLDSQWDLSHPTFNLSLIV